MDRDSKVVLLVTVLFFLNLIGFFAFSEFLVITLSLSGSLLVIWMVFEVLINGKAPEQEFNDQPYLDSKIRWEQHKN